MGQTDTDIEHNCVFQCTIRVLLVRSSWSTCNFGGNSRKKIKEWGGSVWVQESFCLSVWYTGQGVKVRGIYGNKWVFSGNFPVRSSKPWKRSQPSASGGMNGVTSSKYTATLFGNEHNDSVNSKTPESFIPKNLKYEFRVPLIKKIPWQFHLLSLCASDKEAYYTWYACLTQGNSLDRLPSTDSLHRCNGLVRLAGLPANQLTDFLEQQFRPLCNQVMVGGACVFVVSLYMHGRGLRV